VELVALFIDEALEPLGEGQEYFQQWQLFTKGKDVLPLV